MDFGFRPRIRHPFLPGLTPAPAVDAKGISAALYGRFPELVNAALAGARATRAILVTLYQDEPALTAQDRDLLWSLFQVPAFALIVDRQGRVVGAECEARSGIHPYPPVSTHLCHCGRPL